MCNLGHYAFPTWEKAELESIDVENTVNHILLPLHMPFSISSQLNSFRFHYVCSLYIDE